MITTHPSAKRQWRRRRERLFRKLLAPPPKLTVTSWADRYRMLSPEASAEPGKYRSARAPYQRGIMDAASDPMIEHVVLMMCSQVGKTEILNNIVGYYIDQDPAPILVVMPTLSMAEAWSKDRLAPMLRDTPRLRGKVASPRSRDSGNTLLHKIFPGGNISIVGANSPADLAGRPKRVVAADEVDRFPASAGPEGDPLSLAWRRTATFWNRKLIESSTPTLKGKSRIEESFNESDQRHYYVPCPQCQHMQPLVWAQLKWEPNAPETAHYECEECGAAIEEWEKGILLERGRWIANNPGSRIAGFHLNALYSPWARWSELVTEFLQAKRNPERLKTFTNTILAETWEEEGEQVEAHHLKSRLEPAGSEKNAKGYGAERYIVPNGVGILTAAVDVQGTWLELLVKGYGADSESWLIAHELIEGDPSRDEVWKTLEAWRTRAFHHESGAALHIAAMCIDTGGHHAQQVYRYTAHRPSTWAIKGASTPGRPIWGRPSRPNKHGARLVTIGTDTAKDLIFARMRIREPGPGYMHLPRWVDDEYLAQLTSEKVVTRFVRGRPVRRYEKTRPRNEALDLEVYALAALYSLGRTVIESLGGRARGLLSATEKVNRPAAAATPARRPRPRPPGWANRWR